MTSEPIYISCHCQEHIVQLHLPEGGSLDADVIDQATTDDCSHCVKRRLLWYRVPDNVRVEVIKGFGKDGVELKDYQFARGRLNHQASLPPPPPEVSLMPGSFAASVEPTYLPNTLELTGGTQTYPPGRSKCITWDPRPPSNA